MHLGKFLTGMSCLRAACNMFSSCRSAVPVQNTVSQNKGLIGSIRTSNSGGRPYYNVNQSFKRILISSGSLYWTVHGRGDGVAAV